MLRDFLLLIIWVFHVRRLSKCIPKYMVASARGISVPFSVTGGQVFLRVVIVTCTDFSSFGFIFQLTIHLEILSRLSWSFTDALVGCSLTESTAVSSANVPIMIPLVKGISEVKRLYKIGPSTLPCGTPACISLRELESSPCRTRKCRFVKKDLRNK